MSVEAAANANYGSTASGSSFYAAMRILPHAQREAMFQIYSFCRQVDDIADSDGPRPERLAALLTPVVKACCTEQGFESASRALQVFGGYGYLKDYPIERFWRDLRVHRILEGTNEVMKLIIGRDLLRQ